MSSGFRRQLVAAGGSLVVSLALGVGLSWRAAAAMIEHQGAKRKPAVADERAKGWDFWTIEIENLSHELKDERTRLQRQSELIEQRSARLASEAKELEKTRNEIDRLRKEISDKVIEITADEAKNLRSLAQTYGTLSPHAVVTIFREMDDTTVVKILSLMKSDVVGPIFEEMTRVTSEDQPLARRAAVLSEKLRLMKSGKS